MRYPLTSEAAKDPLRYAMRWGNDPAEIEDEYLKAKQAKRKAVRIIKMRPQGTWCVYQGGSCNPDGADAPYFRKGVAP